jgi:hypothetical protein
MRDNAFKSLSVCLNYESNRMALRLSVIERTLGARDRTAGHDPCSYVGPPWLVARADHLGGNAPAL